MSKVWKSGFVAIAISLVGVLAIVLGASLALAGPGGGHGAKRAARIAAGGGAEKREIKRGGVVFGTILSISGDSWSIKPEIPPKMAEKMQAKGKPLPQLPEQVTVTVNSSTKFYLNG